MIKLTCYRQSRLSHVEGSALLTPQQIWALHLMTLSCQRSLLIGWLPRPYKNKPDQIIRILQTVSVKHVQDHFVFIYLCSFFDLQILSIHLIHWCVSVWSTFLLVSYLEHFHPSANIVFFFFFLFSITLLRRIIVRQPANVQKGQPPLWLKRALVVWPIAQRVIGGRSACQSGWVFFFFLF